jgi:hypothetical protein
MKSLLPALLASTLFFAPALHAGLDEGVAAYKAGDYARALRELRPLAEQGNARAQSTLGVMYAKGHGVPQDYKQAMAWFHKATEQGHAIAQINLGLMYDNGHGVPQNAVAAYALYNLSAALDSSSGNNASSNRSKIAASMSAADIEAAQTLSRDMAKPGNLLAALDAHLKRAPQAPTRKPTATKP